MDFKKEYVNALLIIGKSCGAGVGVGIVFGSLIYSISRNPLETNNLFKFAMLGFALTEAVGLLALMMAFLILFS